MSPSLLCRPTSTPSQQPSEETVMTYDVEMEIGFESYASAMDDREEDILENALQSFLSTTKDDLDWVSIEILLVKFKSQYRVAGLKNCLLSSKLSERMTLEDDKEETAEIGLRVSVFVCYGVEPKVLPLEDLLSSGLKTSFDDFVKELEDGFSMNNVISQKDRSGAEHNDNVTNNLQVPISVLAVACGVAGMILGITLLLVYSRHKNRRRQAARIVRGWSAIEDTIGVSLSALCLVSGHTIVSRGGNGA